MPLLVGTSEALLPNRLTPGRPPTLRQGTFKAEMMDQKQMRLLRGRAAFPRDDEIARREAPGLAAAATEEGDGLEL